MTLLKVNNPISKGFDGFVNELLNEFPGGFSKTIREGFTGFPPVNIFEKTDSYVVEMAAPGRDKSDFKVKLDNNLLTVSAEKKDEPTTENTKSIRREFSNQGFKRSFSIDEKIDTSNISAKYENGILQLNLPKKEEAKVGSKEITIL